MMPEFEILRMQESDCEAVSLLERECFSSPWSHSALIDGVKNPDMLFYICKSGDKILGYISAYTVCDEANIINLAVFKEYRKLGVGSFLIEFLKSKFSEQNIKSIFLEVRQSNAAAQNLYKKCGFVICGQRKNFYKLPCEDAYILSYTF